jgi:hypothetical protein
VDGDGRPLDWYGGKTHFRATLIKESGRNYRIKLEKAELGTSSSLFRRFGSKNFLAVKVPKDVWNSNGNRLDEFFKRPFVLLGRIYRALRAQDQTVMLIRTNQGWAGGAPSSVVCDDGIDFLGLVDMVNPLSLNQDNVCMSSSRAHQVLNSFIQKMRKWAARFALGFSNSVPGGMVMAKNIEFIDDEGAISHSRVRFLLTRSPSQSPQRAQI